MYLLVFLPLHCNNSIISALKFSLILFQVLFLKKERHLRNLFTDNCLSLAAAHRKKIVRCI